MKYSLKYHWIALTMLVLVSCGGSGLEEKKKELAAAKAEAMALEKKIGELEEAIAKLDTTAGDEARNAVLVSTIALGRKSFEHKIEARGTVASRRNVMVSAEIPGRIESVSVREGQRVQKGQVMLRLDASVIGNNIKELETRLELAKAVYERQANLWKKNIGTEIQYLEAKNGKEALESSLATARAQLNQATIRAPFTGSVDEVPALIGEMASPGVPLVRVVNPDDIYIDASISEAYIGQFKKGDSVAVYFPSQDKNLSSTVAAVSQVINGQNRTFAVEVKLPKVDFPVKPNQVAVVQLRDYENKSALTVPTNIIQKDNLGAYIYKTASSEKGLSAQKVHIKTGVSYDKETEVLEGLSGDESIINEGFRELNDGILIKIADRSSAQPKTMAGSK